MTTKTVYLSFDIEADGPSPARNNMISLGICGLDINCNELYRYEANILPLVDHSVDPATMARFWDKNPVAWTHATSNQITCIQAMDRLADDLAKLTCDGYRFVWVAQPAAYDWQWLNYYWNYAIDHDMQPSVSLGYKADCISTMFSTYVSMKKNIDQTKLWNELYGHNPSDHVAYYDARHQGYVYVKLLKLISE